MIGCGWVWLVKNNGNMDRIQDSLSILTTFNGASPLFKSDQQQSTNFSVSSVKNSPILGLNLWESAFILDYGIDREAYVQNWWKAVNWNVVSVLLSK